MQLLGSFLSKMTLRFSLIISGALTHTLMVTASALGPSCPTKLLREEQSPYRLKTYKIVRDWILQKLSSRKSNVNMYWWPVIEKKAPHLNETLCHLPISDIQTPKRLSPDSAKIHPSGSRPCTRLKDYSSQPIWRISTQQGIAFARVWSWQWSFLQTLKLWLILSVTRSFRLKTLRKLVPSYI